MALPEVLPIRTSDRITFELRPVTKEIEVEVDGQKVKRPVDAHDWFAVSGPNGRLAAIVSPIGYLDMRGVRGIEDPVARVDKVLELARVEAFHQSKPVSGGAVAIPETHIYSLVARVIELSSVGSDPFAEAPAASQP